MDAPVLILPNSIASLLMAWAIFWWLSGKRIPSPWSFIHSLWHLARKLIRGLTHNLFHLSKPVRRGLWHLLYRKHQHHRGRGHLFAISRLLWVTTIVATLVLLWTRRHDRVLWDALIYLWWTTLAFFLLYNISIRVKSRKGLRKKLPVHRRR